jgi:EpsI family protein
MPLFTRSLIAAALLAVALVAQLGLGWHLRAAGALADVALPRPLKEIVPIELDGWQGHDLEISDIALYGDDHVKRAYLDPRTGQRIDLWVAYSKDGKDRGHHPEICLDVQGMAEDHRGEAQLEVDTEQHPAPIQQFLYRNTDRALYMYYWHYTLRPPQQENIDDLQRLYQRMQRRCSSMTIEVSTYDISPEARERTVAFVEAVDRALQKDLPPLAVRGSNRTPVRRLEAH